MSFCGYLTPPHYFFSDIKNMRDIRDIRNIEIARDVKDFRDTKDFKDTIDFRVYEKNHLHHLDEVK